MSFTSTDVLLDSAIVSRHRELVPLLFPKTQHLSLQDMACGFNHVPLYKEFQYEILVSHSLRVPAT